MKIALDWDGTYTLDPIFWTSFILMCKHLKHDVRIVTMRKPEMKDADLENVSKLIPIIYTSSMQKREYCDMIDWQPQIWVDDSPEFIVRRDVYTYLEVFNPKKES